jgi:hypothetical protein
MVLHHPLQHHLKVEVVVEHFPSLCLLLAVKLGNGGGRQYRLEAISLATSDRKRYIQRNTAHLIGTLVAFSGG